jgi:hypothetical protein
MRSASWPRGFAGCWKFKVRCRKFTDGSAAASVATTPWFPSREPRRAASRQIRRRAADALAIPDA